MAMATRQATSDMGAKLANHAAATHALIAGTVSGLASVACTELADALRRPPEA